jgi:hypothetical protein
MRLELHEIVSPDDDWRRSERLVVELALTAAGWASSPKTSRHSTEWAWPNLASAAVSVFLLRPEFEVLRTYLDQLKAPSLHCIHGRVACRSAFGGENS